MTDAEREREIERLMAVYGEGIKRFCALQLQDAYQGEDAAQDTFIRV